MLRAIGFALVSLWFLAATPAHAQDDSVERVRIRGSQTLASGLVPAVASSWLRDIGYGDIRVVRKGAALTEIHAVRDDLPLIVEIGASSSARGFTDLVDGNTQVAMMTRRPTAAELDAGWQLGDLGSQDQEFVLALDGVAVVVNQRNPIAGLSLPQLQRIFAGQVRDWRELGGAAGRTRVDIERVELAPVHAGIGVGIWLVIPEVVARIVGQIVFGILQRGIDFLERLHLQRVVIAGQPLDLGQSSASSRSPPRLRVQPHRDANASTRANSRSGRKPDPLVEKSCRHRGRHDRVRSPWLDSFTAETRRRYRFATAPSPTHRKVRQ